MYYPGILNLRVKCRNCADNLKYFKVEVHETKSGPVVNKNIDFYFLDNRELQQISMILFYPAIHS